MSEQISGYDVFVMYLAFKLHFSSESYNFFKFNGKTKTSITSYNSRKDKYYFDKLAVKFSKQKILEKMLVEYQENPNFWVKDLLEKSNEDRYLKWRGFVEGIEYSLKKEFSFLKEYCLKEEIDYVDLFKTKTSQHPIIFKSLLRKDIRVETFIVLDSIIGISEILSKKNSNDPVWITQHKFMLKYYPFVSGYLPDSKTNKKLFKETFVI